MTSCSFTHGEFLKTGSYVFINTCNTEFFTHYYLVKTNEDTRYGID